VKVYARSILAGLLVVGLWVVMIWLASVNLFAEGPDTRLASTLAAPLEGWSGFVGPAIDKVMNVVGLKSKAIRNGTSLVTVFMPSIVLASVPFFLLFRPGTRQLPPNKSLERTRQG
jgi:hypothetical protein